MTDGFIPHLANRWNYIWGTFAGQKRVNNNKSKLQVIEYFLKKSTLLNSYGTKASSECNMD